LIREFFDAGICFEIVGKHGATLKEQLDNFAQALGKAIGMGIQPQRPVYAALNAEIKLRHYSPKTFQSYGLSIISLSPILFLLFGSDLPLRSAPTLRLHISAVSFRRSINKAEVVSLPLENRLARSPLVHNVISNNMSQE